MHPRCFGVKSDFPPINLKAPKPIDTEGWLCQPCRQLIGSDIMSTDRIECQICCQTNRQPEIFKKMNDGSGYAHLVCALWIDYVDFLDQQK